MVLHTSMIPLSCVLTCLVLITSKGSNVPLDPGEGSLLVQDPVIPDGGGVGVFSRDEEPKGPLKP